MADQTMAKEYLEEFRGIIFLVIESYGGHSKMSDEQHMINRELDKLACRGSDGLSIAEVVASERDELKGRVEALEKELKVANGHLDELTDGVNFVACTPFGGE